MGGQNEQHGWGKMKWETGDFSPPEAFTEFYMLLLYQGLL